MVLGYLYWIWDHFAPVIIGLAGGIGYGLLTNYKNFDWKDFIIWPFIGSGVGATYIPFSWAGLVTAAATVFLASRAEDLWGLIKKFFTPVTPVEKVAAPLVVPEIPEEIIQAEEAGDVTADITLLEELSGLVERWNKQCQLHPRCAGCPHVISNPTVYGATCDYVLAFRKMAERGKGTIHSVLRYMSNLIALQTQAVEKVQKSTWNRAILGFVLYLTYKAFSNLLFYFAGIYLPI